MTTRLSLTELESYILTIDAARYTSQRNYLGSSTNLSEYITRGFISLPRVRELILHNNSPQAAYKLINELAWREYWQQTWRVRQDEIFDYFRPLNFKPRQGIPTAVLDAKTGITALDAGIRQLYDTGYIHNHMRMWLAGLICNIAHCDWKVGAEWMHSLLIDGDYASNHLSWQWVAGSYTGSAYLPQQDNINTYTRTSQSNSYLDYDYEYLANMQVPAQLSALTTVLPDNESQPLAETITLNELQQAESLLLYSPWTLDPLWRADEQSLKVLIMPTEMYSKGTYGQNVLDSISHFSENVPNLKTIYLDAQTISKLKNWHIYRKDYPGIAGWPGTVDDPELLFPNVPLKFYPSFSAFWKQASKKA